MSGMSSRERIEIIPIVRVEMVGDLTAILGSAKFEVVKAEEENQ